MSLQAFVKSELPRLIGFCFVGGAGFIVHAGMVYILTHFFQMDDILAWFPAFILAVIITWLMNRFLTFRGLGNHSAPQEAARYFIIESIGAAINFAVYFAVITAKIPVLSYPVLALACGAGTAFIFNYFALRMLVYQNAGPSADMDALQSASETDIDDIYYEHAMSIPFARKMTIHARKRMFKHFLKTMRPDENSTILDFGASETENKEANILEKSYSYIHNITCVGLGDGHAIKDAYPEIKYMSIEPGAPLPFADNTFDIAYSNAVFEHVGSKDNRLFILRELIRVSKYVYIATPNRWFPIEHHTGIPLLHFIPSIFRSFTKNGKYEFWSVPQNLQFLSLSDLKTVFKRAGIKGSGGWTGIVFGPFSSNIAFWTNAK